MTYGAARRTDRLQALADHGVRTVPLDVTDDDSARACFDRIIDEAGHLDVLVNNARAFAHAETAFRGHCQRIVGRWSHGCAARRVVSRIQVCN